MTVKTRGIQLKNHLSPEDQGQRKLMQVTFSQLAALSQTTAAVSSADQRPPTAATSQSAYNSSAARKRAIARMLRIELEATLALLDQALKDVATPGPQEPDGKPRSDT